MIKIIIKPNFQNYFAGYFSYPFTLFYKRKLYGFIFKFFKIGFK